MATTSLERAPKHAPDTAADPGVSPAIELSPLIAGLLSGAAAIPFKIRSVAGYCIGYLAGLLPLRERRIAILQLRNFLPEHSAIGLVPKVFGNAGQTLLESLSLRPILRQASERIACEGWEHVDGWIQDQRPIICLTAHTGNWDLLAAYVISRGIPLTTIGREARNPTAQAILRSIREGYGIETIWRSDRSGLKRIISCLKERRVLAALIDQDTRVESVSSLFFNRPAKTPVSLITMGRKMNARFVTAFLFREGLGRYRVFVEDLGEADTDIDILDRYNKRLESYIRRYPSQWVWFHKRWRTTPEGVTLSSREYARTLEEQLRKSS